MRRLPVYFLVDVSDSMAGQPIEEAAKGIEQVMIELRKDPYALETVHASVLAFAGQARELVPLTDICLFQAPALPIGSGTHLGKGLELLMRRMDQDVRKTTRTQKGDWKPVIFLLTDGAPTDDPGEAIKRWNENYRKKAEIVAITLGTNADVSVLQQISDNVLTLRDTTPESLREFFRWVSASLKVFSVAMAEQGGEGGRLPGYCINLEKAEPNTRIDENFVIIPVKCSSSKKLWLAKYAHGIGGGWDLEGNYPVDQESYDMWSETGTSRDSIDLADVSSIPDCPVCGSKEGLVKCGECGSLACCPTEGTGHCPWCGAPYKKIRHVDSMTAQRSRG